jgi:hypothetical protein
MGLGDEANAQSLSPGGVAEQNEKKLQADLEATTLAARSTVSSQRKISSCTSKEYLQPGTNFAEVAALDA